MLKNCEVCNKEFKPHHKTGRFCSRICLGVSLSEKTKTWTIVTLQCPICNTQFNRKVWPKTDTAKLKCSSTCGAKQARLNDGCQLAIEKQIVCKQCGEVFSCKEKASSPREFCSKRCSTKFCAHGRTFETRYQKWLLKFGEEEAAKRLAAMSEKYSRNAVKSNTGREVKQSTRDKIKNGLQTHFYETKAGIMQRSVTSKRNKHYLAIGKTQPFGTSAIHVQGHYKGVYIRSSYEYGFIKKMEAQGFKFGEDLLYEPAECHVMFQDDLGIEHCYRPDFLFKPTNTVYEVKCEKFVMSNMNKLKFEAARKFLLACGFKFEIITEADLIGFRFNRQQICQDENFRPGYRTSRLNLVSNNNAIAS